MKIKNIKKSIFLKYTIYILFKNQLYVIASFSYKQYNLYNFKTSFIAYDI
jgi:hypothetical protein